MEAQIANIYIDFILKILYKIYYNMFSSVSVGSMYSNLKPKPNRTETEPKF